MQRAATTTQASWSHFEHGADIGVRGTGATPAEAFAQAALALTAIVVEPERVEPREAVAFACAAPDLELLLVDWLNLLIDALATRGLLFGRFEVTLAGTRLEATAWGEHIDVARHAPAVEPKAVTYTALAVFREADGRWQAQTVVDV